MKPTLEQIKTDESVWPEKAQGYAFSYKTEKGGFTYVPFDSYQPCGGDVIHIPRPTKAFVPEVGEWCETSGGAKVFYVGLDSHDTHIFTLSQGGLTRYETLDGFKALKTERELFVEAAIDCHSSVGHSEERMLNAMFDSGKFKLVEPTK